MARRCAHPSCVRVVDGVACDAHWQALPEHLRDAVRWSRSALGAAVTWWENAERRIRA